MITTIYVCNVSNDSMNSRGMPFAHFCASEFLLNIRASCTYSTTQHISPKLPHVYLCLFNSEWHFSYRHECCLPVSMLPKFKKNFAFNH